MDEKTRFKLTEFLNNANIKNDNSNKNVEHLMPMIFKKTTDENFLSDWLAYILNPKINSLGVKPLNILLKPLFNIELSDNCETDMGDVGEYSACREVYLNSNNRIDFLFSVTDNNLEEKYLIGIENKIMAGESKPDQLKIYSDLIEKLTKRKTNNTELKKYFGYENILLIFLTIDGYNSNSPGKFKAFSHKTFIENLKKIPTNPLENLRASFLVNEYIKNMEDYIVNNQYDENFEKLANEDISLIANNILNIKKIIKEKENIENNIRYYIYKSVNDKCFDSCQNGYTAKYSESKDLTNKKYNYWYKNDWNNNGNIHYEILFANDTFDNDGIVNVKIVLHVEDNDERNQLKKRNIIPRTNTIDENNAEKKIIDKASIEQLTNDVVNKMKYLIEKWDETLSNFYKEIH